LTLREKEKEKKKEDFLFTWIACYFDKQWK